MKKAFKNKYLSYLLAMIILVWLLGSFSGCTLRSVLGIPEDPTQITKDVLSAAAWKAALWLSSFFGIIAGIMFAYGGIKYMTALGNEQEVEKAKNTIIWALVGMIIVALAGLFIYYLLNTILGVSWNPPA